MSLTTPTLAQDSDEAGGLLVDLLEDTLSGDSRTIDVTGLSGALSARASIEQITVSDDDGVWLTIRGAVLDWNRLALLRGQFQVNTLRADTIILARAPTPVPSDPELPSPEAQPFKLPELPVSIDIGELAVDTLELGEALVGVAAELTLSGAITLADGELAATLAASRLDRPSDRFDLVAGFANETDMITLDLVLAEAANGLVSNTLGLPGRPSLRLSAVGTGPVADFTADLQLATEGTDRLTGQVTLRETDQATAFQATLGGDVQPLLAPEYRSFFGTDTRLQLSGQTGEQGVDIPDFSLKSNALQLSGSLATNADGALAKVAVQGRVRARDGAAVLLPLTGAQTRLDEATLDLTLDGAQGGRWALNTNITGLDRPDLTLAQATLRATGTLDQQAGTRLAGQIDAALAGLAFDDAKLAGAVGDAITLNGGFDWSDGRLALADVALAGSDYSATLTGQISGLDSALAMAGQAEVSATDLSRFGPLAGLDLAGRTTASLSGTGAPLSGAFDLTLMAEAQDLATGIAQIDPLITGASTVSLIARRNEAGTQLEQLTIDGTALSASASGTVESTGTALTFQAELDDLGRVVPSIPGPVTLSGDVTQDNGALAGSVRLRAPAGAQVDLRGRQEADGAADVTFDAELAELARYVEQLPGRFTANGRAQRRDGIWQITSDTVAEAGLNATLDGSANETTGDLDFDFDAQFSQLSRFVPQLDGTLLAQGNLKKADAQVTVSARTSGVAGIAAEVLGDMNIETGNAQLDYDVILADLARFVPQLPGSVVAKGRATLADEQVVASAKATGSAGVSGDINAQYQTVSGDLVLNYDAALANLAKFVPQLRGSVTAKGRAQLSNDVLTADVKAAGSAGVSGDISAEYQMDQGDITVDYDAALADLAKFVAQLPGSIRAQGRAELKDDQLRARAKASGSAGVSGDVSAEFDTVSGDLAVDYTAALAQLARFVPQLAGSVAAEGRVTRRAESWQAKAQASGDAGVSGTFDVRFDEKSQDIDARYDAQLARIERLAGDISGTLSAKGTAKRAAAQWQIATQATGPGGSAAQLSGSLSESFDRANLDISGRAPLGLGNRILAPNSISGLANFDLAVRGALGLDALSGTITTSGARFALPALAQTINDLSATITLANGAAQVAVTGAPQDGGRFQVRGPVELSPPFRGTLNTELSGIVLTDNISFNSSANGSLVLAGPLASTPNLSGRIVFGETEFNLASASGSLSAAPIPNIRHINEPRAVRRTRSYAGLIETASGGGSGPVIGLDLELIAQNRVFARGRGLQAELGGAITVRGTSANVVPSGQISLIRGTLDLLGKRLSLDEGRVTLIGQLDPYVDFSASTATSEGEATVTISGPLSGPRIDVTASPERPTEEALALLLFGETFADLSPLRIAQLASQLATLNGNGGGATTRLRENLGVDSLDLGTDADGNAQLGVGTYLAEGVYTDVTINSRGESQLNLNLDVTDNLTLKGSVDDSGETGLGLFFQRDY
ncbi:MAG: translocation/assembly module TamB domain-containing protein [Sedimentitalea sp.]